ncbi:MAG: DUF192 domain-containing protein [Candidatus Aenigmatarchaeota archaeon]|nr:MAG: DUF192 domain-containing protein [Candidatus Aenigmarchaeota archaeon]
MRPFAVFMPIAILGALFVFALQFAGPSGGALLTTDDGYRTSLSIADSPEERERGLMNTTIKENEGMLFVFGAPARGAFWMKDVPQELDIVLLSDDLKVVALFRNLPPCFEEECPTYASPVAFRYAIEVQGGFAEKHGVDVGDALQVTL